MPELTKDTRLLVVGMGLIGGSLAAALSAAGYTVGGLDPDGDAVAYARARGYIADGRTDPDPAYLASYDVILLALYPHILENWVRENAAHLRPGTVLSDATGVKGDLVGRVQAMLPDGVSFIAAHPMAGRETSGVRQADPVLFRGANFLITPTERNTEGEIALCRSIGRALGCGRIAVLSPAAHDEMIAFVSQLTHLIAVALMTCRDSAELSDYTGDSFRDLTRIAHINDAMWSELFLLNRTALLAEMDRFAAQFAYLRAALADGDREALCEAMRLSTKRRDAFDAHHPPRQEPKGGIQR